MRERPKTKKRRHLLAIFSAVIIIAALAVLYLRPLPALYPTSDVNSIVQAAQQTKIDWPSSGESAVGAIGYGVLATSGQQTERPTASTAKLIDALTVLKKYPLKLGQTGPTITLGPSDVAIYNKYASEQGSVAKVQAGEQISEYQLLQGMMLPSANNMADSLAIWAFGSLNAYQTAAMQTVSDLGLSHTKVGSDASGFLPDTVSTAHDLVLLGEAAMQNPVLAQIVAQPTANLPVAGKVKTYNFLLGQDGIVGVKTGNSNQAGGVYIFAKKYTAGAGHSVMIVGAVQGLPTLWDVLKSSLPLLNSAERNFQLSTLVKAGQTIATYNLPWGGSAKAVAANNLDAFAWSSDQPKVLPNLHAVYAPQANGSAIGSLGTSASPDSTKVVLNQRISSPPWWWRIIRHKL